MFVGEGPLRGEMERLISSSGLKNVHILGFRNQSELPACYAMADALVLPSESEPWGLVVNEAMCFGLPIVVSDRVGSAPDLVRSGRNGFVYPMGDVSALAGCLRKLIANDVARAEMGRQSMEIITRWGLDQDVEGILAAAAYVTRQAGRESLSKYPHVQAASGKLRSWLRR